MAEVTAYCYQKIRDNLNTLAQYIGFNNSTGTQKLRIPVSDSRVTHVFNDALQTQTYTIVLKGSDADITLPCELASSNFYETNVSANALSSEIFTVFTLESALDQITITHSIQIPQVV